jgi:hypothetical protein
MDREPDAEIDGLAVVVGRVRRHRRRRIDRHSAGRRGRRGGGEAVPALQRHGRRDGRGDRRKRDTELDVLAL